jgi:hypothetical protein
MAILPTPENLPFTADLYRMSGKPAALVPGQYGVIYEPAPRYVPWTELMRKGTPISQQQFSVLLYNLN